jgi:hypothetical protein
MTRFRAIMKKMKHPEVPRRKCRNCGQPMSGNFVSADEPEVLYAQAGRYHRSPFFLLI